MIELTERDKEIFDKIKNLQYIAQVDESGAGCLSGNLVVAAVILDPDNPIEGLNDSKKLTEKKREKLFSQIIEKALEYSIITISPKEIDDSNILAMRMEGMKRAVNSLKNVEYALIDGNRLPEGLIVPADYIIKGDAKSEGIAAASILAKVTRDRQIVEAAKLYPQYGFEKHKGYGTKTHKEALEKYGVCEIHRMSYKPVRENMTEEQFEKWKSRTR
jgi:ribonuclease HII